MNQPSDPRGTRGRQPFRPDGAALLHVLPAALWYALIFWFSSKSAAVSGGQSDGLLSRALNAVSPAFRAAGAETRAFSAEVLSFPARKCAHMFLYFTLALLLLFALARLTRRRRGPAVLALAGLLAALDEYHQTFVPGRSGELRDVLVDLCGAAVALGLWRFLLWALTPGGRRRVPWTLALPVPVLAAALAAPLWTGPAAALLAARYVEGFPLLDAGVQTALLTGAAPILQEALTAGALGLLALWALVLALLRTAGRRPG